MIYIYNGLFRAVRILNAGFNGKKSNTTLSPKFYITGLFCTYILKHYMKLYGSKNFTELKENISKSIKNIKEENYKNYFIYAYNKDHYKKENKDDDKKTPTKRSSSKHRKPKIYKD